MTPLEIIYADSDMIVLNKPPGMSVHGGSSVSGPALTDHLAAQFPEIKSVGDDPLLRPGIVHRLDKDTSGVMVVARNQKSFDILKALFKTRKVEKIYRAIVCGTAKKSAGIISLPIGRLIKNPLKRGAHQEGKHTIRGARAAHTEYRVLKAGKYFSLMELKPHTGRMHQLRVHMKAIGNPIACDRTYGGKNVGCPQGASRQLLHAQSLSFTLYGVRISFEADPPEDFAFALQQIL